MKPYDVLIGMLFVLFIISYLARGMFVCDVLVCIMVFGMFWFTTRFRFDLLTILYFILAVSSMSCYTCIC